MAIATVFPRQEMRPHVTSSFVRSLLMTFLSSLEGRLSNREAPPCKLLHRSRRLQQRPALSHTAVVENKRLGHALSIFKAQQNLKPTTTVMTNRKRALPKANA